MVYRSTLTLLALATALTLTVGDAKSQDKKYPNWKGEWSTINGAPAGPEIEVRSEQAVREGAGGSADAKNTRRSTRPTWPNRLWAGRAFSWSCLLSAGGMPTMMSAGTHEFIITPETTYISAGSDLRRIFTDGRPWPTDMEPTYQGFSMGKWIDEDGDGVYDVLEVETRGPFKGPRAYDATGLPLHFDNNSTFKERVLHRQEGPDILHDVITVFDHALTRPWTVDKTYRRGNEEISELEPDPLPGRNRLCHHRQGVLSGGRGRLLDADQQGTAAA